MHLPYACVHMSLADAWQQTDRTAKWQKVHETHNSQDIE